MDVLCPPGSFYYLRGGDDGTNSYQAAINNSTVYSIRNGTDQNTQTVSAISGATHRLSFQTKPGKKVTIYWDSVALSSLTNIDYTGVTFNANSVGVNEYNGSESFAGISNFVATVLGITSTGPTSGMSGVISTTFTVTMNGTAVYCGTDVITLTASNGTITVTAAGGSISGNGTGTVAVTPAANQRSFNFTYTPSSSGGKMITFTNGQGWTNPSASTYLSLSTVFRRRLNNRSGSRSM
jgi:hypothetical protein